MPINKMSNLLNKIERRLGTLPLNLPDFLSKDKWASEVICNETLDTFSRFFPNKIRISIRTDQKKKNGYYLIDDDVCDGVEILGVRDIGWDEFAQDSIRLQQSMGYGVVDFLSQGYSMDDIGLIQMRADHTSLFNNVIYIDFKPPNMIKLTSVTGADLSRGMERYPIDLLIKHADNLMTISPTKMEIFERLAQADVARFLVSNLKYYDGLETVYANIDLKIGDLENEASKRDDVVQEMKEGYVSAANENQPIIFTV